MLVIFTYYLKFLNRKGFIMYHILVCDDEKEIVEAIRIYLEEEGYQVTICLESKNAMEIIQKQNINNLNSISLSYNHHISYNITNSYT